jgi:hypothetical protein
LGLQTPPATATPATFDPADARSAEPEGGPRNVRLFGFRVCAPTTMTASRCSGVIRLRPIVSRPAVKAMFQRCAIRQTVE